MRGKHRALRPIVAVVALAAAVAAPLAISSAPAGAATGITRLSVSRTGAAGNWHSDQPSISDDGRFVVFRSTATNLVTNDSSSTADIFLRDRANATTVKVSRASNGGSASSSSEYPAISGDGRFVVYQSFATNIVVGDTNGQPDIFRYEVATGSTIRVSVATNGAQLATGGRTPSISADGTLISFESSDALVRDVLAGTTTQVNYRPDGSVAKLQAGTTRLSANGRYVAFSTSLTSASLGGTGAFRRDLTLGVTHAAHVGHDGTVQESSPFLPFTVQGVTNTGAVAFVSERTQLVAGDTDAVADLFVRDVDSGTIVRASATDTGTATASVEAGSITPNGRFVTFKVSGPNVIGATPTTTGVPHLYRRDLVNGAVVGIDTAMGGGPSTGVATAGFADFSATLSADGVQVAFSSQGTDITSDDVGWVSDVFHGTMPAPPTALPPMIACTPADDVWRRVGTSSCTAVAPAEPLVDPADAAFDLATAVADGVESAGAQTGFRRICTTAGACVFAGPITGFNVDRKAPTLAVQAPATGSRIQRGAAVPVTHSCSDAGSGVVECTSSQPSGTHLDTSEFGPINYSVGGQDALGNQGLDSRSYLITTLAPGNAQRISTAPDGTEGSSISGYPAVSSDGRYVAFESLASNLVADDTNNVYDVFVADRETGTIEIVSRSSTGQPGNNHSATPSMSADGRFVMHLSLATNLVAGTTLTTSTLHVRDRVTGTNVAVTSPTGASPNAAVRGAWLVPDGSAVLFSSAATNLGPTVPNGVAQIYRKPLPSGPVELISRTDEGVAGTRASQGPVSDASGRIITYQTAAAELAPGASDTTRKLVRFDRVTGTRSVVAIPDAMPLPVDSTPDGRYIVYKRTIDPAVPRDTGWAVLDTTTSTTRAVGIDPSGLALVTVTQWALISDAGRFVVFEGIVDGGPAHRSAFLYDLLTESLTEIPSPITGVSPNAQTNWPVISGDATTLVFASQASDLVPGGDRNRFMDIFVQAVDVGATITGRVTDVDTGQPVAGVSVRVYRSGESSPLKSSMSAVDGTYVIGGLDEGDHQVSFSKSGSYLTTWFDGAATRSTATTVTLGSSGVVTVDGGVVPVPLTPDTVAPVVSCAVADDSWHGSNVSIACTASDADSGLRVAADAEFTLSTTVTAGVESSNAATTTYAVCDRSNNCTTAGPITGNKVDRKAPSVSFTAPANGASIIRGASVAAGFTCADGGAGVGSCDGSTSAGSPVPTTSLGASTLSVTATDLAGNTATATRNYTVVADGVIGTVTNAATGLPAAGVNVRLWTVGGSSFAFSTVTADDGTYAIDGVPAGSYQVQFTKSGSFLTTWHPGLGARSSSATIALGPAIRRTVDASVSPPARASGTVTDADSGTPIEGATVRVFVIGAAQPTGTATTAADGTWAVANLLPGTYQVQVQHPTHRTTWYLGALSRADATLVTIGPGAQVVADLAVDDLGDHAVLRGRVTDSVTGLPLASTNVRAWVRGTGTYTYVLTGADGRYELELPAGTYDLQFARSSYLTTWWDGAATRPAATPMVLAPGSTNVHDTTITRKP